MPNKTARPVVHSRYETPWQRLQWTGPLAILAWILAVWGLSSFITKPPRVPEPLAPIDARIIELPEPPKPAPAVRPTPEPTPQPQKRVTPVPKPAAVSEPAASEPAATQTADLPQSTAAPALGNAQDAGPKLPAGGRPQAGVGRRGISVREGAVGVAGRPPDTSVMNEDKPFDFTGMGDGWSPGGWVQEYDEDCPRTIGEEHKCATSKVSQPPVPWCYNASPINAWDRGTCRDDLNKAIAAFKREDHADALARFMKLAEKEYAPAQANLGSMYADGTGVPKDDEQAVYWWRKAAAGGDVKSIYNLALMYADGKGVAKDEKQAAFWFTKAAYWGYALAQYNIGVMYAQGKGVEQDDKKALYWYRKAADRGNTVSQYNLGAMYAEGKGAAKDEGLGMRWYCRAAARGYGDAKVALAELYATGGEAPKERELAYFCWLLAADKRGPSSMYADRDRYEQGLTPEQIANAKAKVDTWKRK